MTRWSSTTSKCVLRVCVGVCDVCEIACFLALCCLRQPLFSQRPFKPVSIYVLVCSCPQIEHLKSEMEEATVHAVSCIHTLTRSTYPSVSCPQIEHLKSEMEEATGIADAVRADLATLKGRVAVVQAEQVRTFGCVQCRVCCDKNL